jgi:hypothetical protein
MKKILLLSLLIFCIKTGYCQYPLYYFPKPPKWGAEKMSFPIDFAPNINFTGIEELRFAPGWSDSKSNEYWAYTFLWFIKGKPRLNQDTLNHYLTQYYNGLYLANMKNKKVAPPANFTMVDVRGIHRLLNDMETYEGRITTLDFLTGKPITFNTRIHVRGYPQMNCTGIFFQVAPQDYKQPVWIAMNNLITGFSVKVDKEF